MDEEASFISSTLITNMSNNQNTLMLNNSIIKTTETSSIWYNIIISININMILVTIITKLRDKSVSI